MASCRPDGCDGDAPLNYGRIVKPDEVLARLMAVTAADIQQLAAELFAPRRTTLSLVVPEKDATDEQTWLGTLQALG